MCVACFLQCLAYLRKSQLPTDICVLRRRRRYWLWHLPACAMYAHGKGHCCHAYDCQHDDVACSDHGSHQLADSCAQWSLCLLWDVQILFQGPHVKMGVYRGRPTGVSPHVTTGRADYFGPFVNRFAALLAVNVFSLTHPHTTQKPSCHHDSVFSRRLGSRQVTPQADVSHSLFSGEQQHAVQSLAAQVQLSPSYTARLITSALLVQDCSVLQRWCTRR